MRDDRKRYLDRLNPIRNAALGQTMSGWFGISWKGDSALVESVTIPIKDGPTLVIKAAPGGTLDIGMRA